MNKQDKQDATANPAVFRERLFIDTDDGPERLTDVCDDWQLADLQALDAGWQAAARRPVTAPGPIYHRSYFERGRGSSKTTDLAIMATWPIFAAQRKIMGVAAAGDRDQARLIVDAIETLARLNPALDSVLEVQNWLVRNRVTGSELSVISSDQATSWGLLRDLICIDEITAWRDGNNGEALFHSLASAAAKRRHCMLAIIANAGLGMGSSWQWAARESFRENPKAYFSRLDGPCASWIGQDMLDEQRRLLPDIAYRRLWLNQWSSGSSDLLADAEIQSAITLPGPSERETHVKYLGGVDLGLSKNAASFVIVGKLGTRVKLVRTWEWKPPRGGKVSIDEIEATIIDAHKRYSLTALACDPWNAAQLVERCRKEKVPIRERPQGGKNLVEQATALLEGFNTRSLDLFDRQPLLRDLRQARLEEKSYGVRIVSPTINGGHGDTLTAFTIALAEARGVVARSGEPWAFIGPRPIMPATTAHGLGPTAGPGGSMYGEEYVPMSQYRPGGPPTPKFF